MKKNDYILIAVIVIIAAALFLIFGNIWNGSAATVEVTVNGKKSGTYSLAENQEIKINGTNVLVIRDGKADMVEADCPDKLCVRQKPISKEGESLICLPNKVIVTVAGGEKNELDAVAE